MSTRDNRIKKEQRERERAIQSNIKFVTYGLCILAVVWFALVIGLIIIGTHANTVKSKVTTLKKNDDDADKELAALKKSFEDLEGQMKCLKEARQDKKGSAVCQIKEISLTLKKNPCELNNGGCDANAICSLKGGKVLCQCKSGYLGDGKNCSDCVSVSSGFNGINKLEEIVTTGWKQCLNWCLKDKKCVAWSYHSLDHQSSNAEKCFTYGDYVKPVYKKDVTSGIARCKNEALMKDYLKFVDDEKKLTTDLQNADWPDQEVIKAFDLLQTFIYYGGMTEKDKMCIMEGPNKGLKAFYGSGVIKQYMNSPDWLACSNNCRQYAACVGWTYDAIGRKPLPFLPLSRGCRLYSAGRVVTAVKRGPMIMPPLYYRNGWIDGVRSCGMIPRYVGPYHIPGLQTSFTGYGCHVSDCTSFPPKKNFVLTNTDTVEQCAEACFNHDPIVHEFTFAPEKTSCYCHLYNESATSPMYTMFPDASKKYLKYVIS